MNEIIKKDVEQMIYVIRGVQVMLDSDLAKLYNCANGTKTINLAVKRHPNRFPERFVFQLTSDECKTISRFQTETLKGQGYNTKYLPYVFTEQGIAILATIIRTKVAEEVSIRIMDAFVKMRHYIMENKNVYKSINNINNKLIEYDEKFDYLFSKFDKKERLFSKGETFDAYYNLVEILNNANNEIIVADNYADITFLDLIRNIKCEVVLITRDSNRLSNTEVDIYNSEYHNLKVIRNNSFHDRFIIIDKKEVYLSGSSFNSIGSKLTMIIKIENEIIKNEILNEVSNLDDY